MFSGLFRFFGGIDSKNQGTSMTNEGRVPGVRRQPSLPKPCHPNSTHLGRFRDTKASCQGVIPASGVRDGKNRQVGRDGWRSGVKQPTAADSAASRQWHQRSETRPRDKREDGGGRRGEGGKRREERGRNGEKGGQRREERGGRREEGGERREGWDCAEWPCRWSRRTRCGRSR